MRSWLISLIALFTLTAGAARAAAQMPPGGGYQTPPSQPVQVLTPEEHQLLMRGEYTDTQVIGGGLVGSFFGYGLGHAVQGRWGDRGWIFTVGEIGSITAMIYGISSCASDIDRHAQCNIAPFVGAALALAGFRIWEIVDVWAAPASHNRKVRELQMRLYYQQPPPPRWSFAIIPTGTRSASAGFSLSF